MEQQNSVPSYLRFPTMFPKYKWFKPLLVALTGFGFYLVFSIALMVIGGVIAANQGYDFQKLLTGGYDTMDSYSPLGALMSLGSIALFIPALMIANRIINYRPFSSYSSSRGGFSFSVFFKCLLVGAIVVSLPIGLTDYLMDGKTGDSRFTVFGFILCTVLGVLQCCAEEYVFRGHLMQMFGSWIKIPVIPIILQTICFALAHPYNVVGVISVAILGLILGFCAYFTKGLEASSALHIVNNLVAFYLTGFGIGKVSTNVDYGSLIFVTVCGGLYLAFMIFASKKLGWFSKVKKDDAAEFNAKIEARNQAKAK